MITEATAMRIAGRICTSLRHIGLTYRKSIALILIEEMKAAEPSKVAPPVAPRFKASGLPAGVTMRKVATAKGVRIRYRARIYRAGMKIEIGASYATADQAAAALAKFIERGAASVLHQRPVTPSVAG